MKLIKPSFEIVDIKPTPIAIPDDMEIGPKMVRDELLKVAYRQIEIAGRTCYKSEDKITDTSAKEFVDRMIKSGHNAMLEFGTIYLKYDYNPDIKGSQEQAQLFWLKYRDNKYSKSVQAQPWPGMPDYGYVCVTTNLRVLEENDWLDDLKYICKPTQYHEKRIHVKFITDRGISHELVRHRVFSFAQESTRYCNYSKDKFGNEITCIIPSWLKLPEGNVNKSEYITEKGISAYSTLKGATEYINNSGITKDKLINAVYLNELLRCENSYFQLLEHGWTPQQARAILPNSLKTEINMCGFASDWEHFFELRDSSHAHPDMQALVAPLHKEFKDKGYV